MWDRRKIQRRAKGPNSQNNLRVRDRRLWANQSSDRRTSSRLLESIPIILSLEPEFEREFREVGIELSSNGLRIRSVSEYPIGANCSLCIYPPELFVPIQIAGQIRWRKFESKTKTYLYGLNFKDISVDTAVHLNKYVDEKSRRTNKVTRKFRKRVSNVFYQKFLKGVLSQSEIGRRGIVDGKADSGLTFEHIYSDKPSGNGLLGRIVDWSLLNLPAAKASRYRKDLIKDALNYEIKKNIEEGRLTRILDLGAGTSKYLIESIGHKEMAHVQALCLDRDSEVVQAGRKIASGRPVRFLKADVFHASHLVSLSEKSGWRPNVVIMSGLIYYFSDKKVRDLLRKIYEWLEPGGTLIVSNMVKNPNKKLIGHLFMTGSGEQWIPLGRPTPIVRNWLVDAGFSVTKFVDDPWGMYCVFCARKAEEPTKSSPFEIMADGQILRGKMIIPNTSRPLKGVILFVHGLGYTYSSYRLDPSMFCNSDFAVCLYNMRGHSNSDGEWALESSIEDVKKLIDLISTRWKGKVPIFLFAHSTGALIALLASMNDHRVSGASVVNIVNSVTDSYRHWHESDYHNTVKEVFKVDGKVPEKINEFLDNVATMEAYKKNLKSWDDLDFPYRYGLARSASFANLARAICFSPDILDSADKIRVPIIFFSGESDEAISVSTTESLFKKIHGKKKIVKTDSKKHFQNDRWDYIQAETLTFFRELGI